MESKRQNTIYRYSKLNPLSDGYKNGFRYFDHLTVKPLKTKPTNNRQRLKFNKKQGFGFLIIKA
jgi:hypothetical protein